MGISAEQLLGAPAVPGAAIPDFAEYIDRVSTVVTPGTRKVYTPYWNKIRAAWGHRKLDEPTPLEIRQLADDIRSNAMVRRNTRGGRSAAEHLIASLRCIYRYAVEDGLITENRNPAVRVKPPRRLASTRHALSDTQVADIVRVATTTGNDPELDGLILRIHLETACRRGGALAVRPIDLDPDQCAVRLHEKGETVRLQPVSPTLMRGLVHHRDTRGVGDPIGQLLRYRHQRPITARRYDHIFDRVGRRLPWVTAQQISIHWFRHTTLTWVERRISYAVARAYAGHEGRADAGTTATYVRAHLHEVAAALAALTGEPHPLATGTEPARTALL
ncbi:tyrosine-type recombinase/integrase [Cryptosporangium sp. NPDC048952]|uniref:tyrosine-type recombinase/integrase n=1 Tax=Cryptosporangium sp. NPDC048952 TaxID=3363961 RepID=UPI0037242C04